MDIIFILLCEVTENEVYGNELPQADEITCNTKTSQKHMEVDPEYDCVMLKSVR